MTSPTACPECGAALTPGAAHCDLCGLPLAASAEAPAPTEEAIGTEEAAAATAAVVPDVPPPAPGQCPVCGATNALDARFCNQCATPLAAAPLVAPEPEPPAVDPGVVEVAAATPAGRPPSDPGKRALALVGVGLAAVVVLYALTQLSNRPAPAQAPPPSTTAAPVPQTTPSAAAPAPLVSVPDSLQDRVEGLQDENTAASWNEIGRVFYRLSRQTDGEARAAFAQQSVDAYDRSLALADDPDVRTNLAAAALHDPRNPMRAVQELQAVLSNDPDHAEANFNMGLLRMQIGRYAQAAESFQHVLAQTTPEEPLHTEAQRALDVAARAQTAGAAGG